MGCGCGGASAAKEKITKYEITDDPSNPKRAYLTEREATAAKANRQLSGTVVAVTR